MPRPYFASRSGLKVTWLAMTSMRLASSAVKMPSNVVSTNFRRQPAFLATALMTSMSKPVSLLVLASWNENGGIDALGADAHDGTVVGLGQVRRGRGGAAARQHDQPHERQDEQPHGMAHCVSSVVDHRGFPR